MDITKAEWFCAGTRVAVLANHRGQWTSAAVRVIATATNRMVKFDDGVSLKLTRGEAGPLSVRTESDGTSTTWVVPAGDKFHRTALVALNAGGALNDANGALFVLKQHDSALAARSAADALEIAARQLRLAADAIEKEA